MMSIAPMGWLHALLAKTLYSAIFLSFPLNSPPLPLLQVPGAKHLALNEQLASLFLAITKPPRCTVTDKALHHTSLRSRRCRSHNNRRDVNKTSRSWKGCRAFSHLKSTKLKPYISSHLVMKLRCLLQELKLCEEAQKRGRSRSGLYLRLTNRNRATNTRKAW